MDLKKRFSKCIVLNEIASFIYLQLLATSPVEAHRQGWYLTKNAYITSETRASQVVPRNEGNMKSLFDLHGHLNCHLKYILKYSLC